jgi:hypothetical protein
MLLTFCRSRAGAATAAVPASSSIRGNRLVARLERLTKKTPTRVIVDAAPLDTLSHNTSGPLADTKPPRLPERRHSGLSSTTGGSAST